MGSSTSKTTRRGQPRPGRHYKPYEIGEIALIYVTKRSDEAKKSLALLLDRTEDAIDMIWRWCEGAGFTGRGADNRIRKQLVKVKELLGDQKHGALDLGSRGTNHSVVL